MALSRNVREMHMQRILAIATQLFYSQRMGQGRGDNQATYYPNIMMSIPNAFVQWEKEHREYCLQFDDPEYEIVATIEEMRSEMHRAFQFPNNFVR